MSSQSLSFGDDSDKHIPTTEMPAQRHETSDQKSQFSGNTSHTGAKNWVSPSVFIVSRNIQRLLPRGRSCPCGLECAEDRLFLNRI